MRKHILLPFLLFLPLLASGQLPIGLAAGLLVNGTQAAAKAARNRAGKPGEFVTYFHVGADSVAMKRTPPEKLRGDAAASIRDEEALLQRCHQAYLRPGSFSIEAEWAFSQQHLQRIAAVQPKWDITPYQQELAFYQREQQRRLDEQRRQQQRAYQLAQARQDSIARVERRRFQQQDSLRAVAYARRQAMADSVAAVELRAARAASPYRYVNATSLALRSKPSTTAPYNTKINAASCVQVLEHLADGWAKVEVFDHVGYVKSDYLVANRNDVTAAGVDWAYMRDASPTYASTMTVEDEPAVKPSSASAKRPASRPVPRPAAGGVVYMCNSGNVVKYHATSGCRGLNRCNASVVRISKAEAQQSMDPCKFCY